MHRQLFMPLGLAVALLPRAAHAESARLHRCLAAIDMNAMTNSQRMSCATSDMDRADGALNAAYRRVIARLPADHRHTLVLAERRWIDRRRATCAATRFERQLNPSGTAGHVVGADYFRMRCLIDETDKRTAELAAMR